MKSERSLATWRMKAAAALVLVLGVASLVGSGGGTVGPPPAGASFISYRNPDPQGQASGLEYYAAVGAAGDTLSAFKSRNHFNDPGAQPASAVYFNAGDLNLGRDMHCNATAEGLACYVSNHAALVSGAPVFADDPTAAFASLNAGTPFATVAMEGGAVVGPVHFAVRECDGRPTPPVPVGTCGLDAPPPFGTGEIRDPAPGVDVDTGIDLRHGDVVTIESGGQIYSGVALTGPNGPAGWDNTDSDPKFPLPGGHPFALIAHVGAEAPFAVGQQPKVEFTYSGAGGRLFLRTNDDTPGNGWGHFDVAVSVRHGIRFLVYDGQGQLLPTAALDTEGPKTIPGVCLSCHGGHYETATHTVSGASFLPFNLKSFRYASGSGQDRAAQEERFRQLNRLVRGTRPTSSTSPDPIAQFIDGMYEPQGVGVPGATARDDFVPPGWAARPNVYLSVVRPYCTGCHLALSPAKDLTDFSQVSADNAAAVQQRVCATKDMPHSQVAFDHFWTDNGGAWPDYLTRPDTLALPSCSR